MADPKVKGLILCVSGPSGVGKDTIINELLKVRMGMCHSISMTTRPPRGDERHGVDYLFTDRETFEANIVTGEILEHDTYCGEYYGTPAKPILDMVEEGTDVILDITIKGAHEVVAKLPDAITIFLMPPSMRSLEQRLRIRGTDPDDQIGARLERAVNEVLEAPKFDYIIVNERIPDTIETILAIYTAEKHRSKRLTDIAAKITSGHWH